MNKKMNLLKKVGISTSLGLVFSNLIIGSTFAGDLVSKANDFTSVDDPPLNISDVADIMSPVTNILFTIATAVLVIVGLIMGVKYMMSEPNDKAKAKEKLIWYFVAVILVYAGVAIAQLIANFFLQNL